MGKPCTCHPDDKPPVPCAKMYALTECRASAYQHAADELERLQRDLAQAKEAIAVLSAGRPIGDIIGLHTAQNAIAEAERLQRENAELQRSLEKAMTDFNLAAEAEVQCRSALAALSQEVTKLTDENAELRAEAERYRWLRDDHIGRSLSVSAISWSGLSADADAAIDAARKEPK